MRPKPKLMEIGGLCLSSSWGMFSAAAVLQGVVLAVGKPDQHAVRPLAAAAPEVQFPVRPKP